MTPSMFPTITKAIRHPAIVNTMATLALRGTTIGGRLVVLFLIAYVATPAEFGLVTFVLAIVETAKAVADFGVDTFAVREFAVTQDRDSQRLLASTLRQTKLICSAIVYLAILIAFLLLSRGPQRGIGAVLGLLVITGLWGNLYIDYFQARLKVDQIFLPVLLVNLATIVSAATLIIFSRRVILGVAILPCSEALNAWILSRHFTRELGFANESVRLPASLGLLRRSLPVAGTLIIAILYTRLDVLFLGSSLDVATVGYYGVASRLTEPFQLAIVALAVSMYSHLSATIATNRQDTRRVVIRYGWGTLSYGVAGCILLGIFAPQVIRWLLPTYSPAIPLLQLLAIVIVFRTLNAYLTSVIHAYGRFVWVTAVAAWSLFALGVLLWILVPRLGARGAALALLVAESMCALIQVVMAGRLVSSERATLTTGPQASVL